MARYIDADELINYLKDLQKPMNIGFGEESVLVSINLKSLISSIESLPTADVRENVNGEWTDHRTLEHDGEFYCSNCGFVLDSYIQGAFYNYCPNCGADMRGEENV